MNQEQAIRYFASHVERAMRKVHSRYGRWFEEDEDRSYCYERILVYAGPEQEGDCDSGLIDRTPADKLDRHVQRALNCDLLSHVLRRVERVRREHYLSIDEFDAPSGSNRNQAGSDDYWYGFIADNGEQAGDGPYTEYVLEHFPTLAMHAYNGLSWRVIAQELHMSMTGVRLRAARETEQFKEWALSEGLVAA